MKKIPVIVLLIATACAPQVRDRNALTRTDLIGSWYGVYPQGRFTVLFDAEYQADGSIETLYYTCLSDTQHNLEKRTGTWQYADNIFTLAYASTENNGNTLKPFIASYRIVSTDRDRVRYVSVETGAKFWKARKLTHQKYTCATDRTTIDAERSSAQNYRRAYLHHSQIGLPS